MSKPLPLSLLLLYCCWPLSAQDLKPLLDRLDRLEQQNRALSEEIRALRQELEEKNAVQEQRVTDQQQTKVEASQRFPIRLTGMALFNAFINGRNNNGSDYPGMAAPSSARTGGATLRQTVIGLDYRGPETFGGGKVSGSVYMDFFAGTGQILNQAMRLRTATIEVDWKSRGIAVGLEKPIFNPREPSSLAQVGVSPLTGAGNLWLWIPQVRFEQTIGGERTGVHAAIGAVQTRESASYQVGSYVPEFEARRPGIEGRFEFYRAFSTNGRIELAPGFHTSTSHVDGASVPSNLFSMDWMIRPHAKLELTGVFFSGQNVAHFGTGGLRQGYTAVDGNRVIPIQSKGGWSQLAIPATSRLTFNLFSGLHDDRDRDLLPGRIGRNLAYGANVFYRIAPNVIVALEASQFRTVYIRTGTLLNNHYDLAVAYQF